MSAPLATMGPAPTPLRRLAWGMACAACVPLLGCDTWQDLRAWFHPDEAPDHAQGNASLRVEVEPPDGITVLLDGVRVASLSPYVAAGLAAGEHTLEVRAMGYHALTLRLKLVDGETLVVPVQLRSRAEPPSPTPQKPAPRPRTKKAPAPPPPPPPPEGGTGPEVPAGVEPIRLTIAVTPPGEIRLDGEATEGRNIELKRTRGDLTLSGLPFRYQIGGAGLLTLTLPRDAATWSKNGQPLAAGSRFKLHRGTVRLGRSDPSGERTVLIRRQ